jgi:hypothetical protein
LFSGRRWTPLRTVFRSFAMALVAMAASAMHSASFFMFLLSD